MIPVGTEWVEPLADWGTELQAVGRPATTRYTRLYHLRRFAHEAHAAPWVIERGDVIEWLARHRWAPETRRSYRSSLHGFYSWAHMTGRIAADPTAMIPPVRLPRVKPRPAPDDAVAQGIRAADPRTRTIITILALTGMRRGEVAALHSRSLERAVDGWQLRIRGKGGHERIIPIGDDLAGVIHRCGDGYLFPGQIDGHLSAAHVGKLVARAMPDGWTAHTLRHRYATLAYAASLDLRAVQNLLGHASIATTQIYTDVPPHRLRAAAAATWAA